MKIPENVPLDMSAAAQTEIDAALEKGYRDMLEGRTRPAAEVFADIKREYNL